MKAFEVLLAVASGDVFDTGERLETMVLAADPLDAAIRAEATMDKLLPDQATQYTHACKVTPLSASEMQAACAA